MHTPYHDIQSVPAGIDPESPVAVVRISGQRSAVAASLLRRHGVHEALQLVDGGVPLWRREGWPIEEPEGAPSGS